MPCKACHPTKKTAQKVRFVQGKYYRHKDGGDFLCAQVDFWRWALICIQTGNRWCDPTALNQVGGSESDQFTELKERKNVNRN